MIRRRARFEAMNGPEILMISFCLLQVISQHIDSLRSLGPSRVRVSLPAVRNFHPAVRELELRREWDDCIQPINAVVMNITNQFRVALRYWYSKPGLVAHVTPSLDTGTAIHLAINHNDVAG